MVARNLRAAAATLFAAMSLPLAAQAQVFQTDTAMTPLPQPVGTAEVNLATQSWGYNTLTAVNRDPMGVNVNGETFGDYYPTFEDGDAITLGGLFKFRGEQIDPVKDAKTAPGYFSPACGFSGELVLRGGDCEISFGWYNVSDPNSMTPPAANEIYPFLPTMGSTITADLMCKAPLNNGFCPLAWDNVDPRQLDTKLWTRRAFDSGRIKDDPRFTGPYVGFAVTGKPGTLCTQTKFSMLGHNQRNANDQPWVTAIIYQSTVDPEGFYMAFEDLPMAKDDWHKTGTNGMNDGDFNDFVFFVSGISCMGGGETCDTGLQGACSIGRTDCATEGTGMCRPIIAPGNELCDNVDNDCNGMVDDGPGLCPGTEVCDKGTCVGACGTGEFRCDTGFSCRMGHCIEDACAAVVCDAGKACRAGACVNPCDGVTCPGGEECQLGRCVDPCKAVTCSAGKVCERGLCVSECSCRGCKDGLVCQADGRCTDPACANVTCKESERCEAGTCVDKCTGVMCPGGAACVNGACQMASGTGGSGSNPDPGGGVDLGGTGIIFGGSTGTGTANSNTGANSSAPRGTSKDPGCACGVVGQSPAGSLALLLGGLGLATATARRRRKAA
jgi:MYXO-CTERM domain-containing protein